MDKTHYKNMRYLGCLTEVFSDNDVLKRVVKLHSFKPKDISSFVKMGEKNVGLSQFNIINTGYLVGERIGMSSSDILLTTVPFHLSAGLSLGVGMSLSHSSQLTFAFPEFNAKETMNILAEEYVTTLVLLGDHLAPLLKEKKPKKPVLISKVVVVLTPNHTTDSSTIESIKTVWDTVDTVSIVYGSQNTGGVIAQSVDGLDSFELLPNTEAIVEDGEFKVRGFNVENETNFVPVGIQGLIETNKLVLSH